MSTTPSLKGTRTEKNLVAAYVAESGAVTRYTFYAKQAEKEKYIPIAEVFKETAANEMHHGKVFFKFLEGGQVEIPVTVDAGIIADTASNLACAAHEEMVEGVQMYTAAAAVADEEGFHIIAAHFRAIATVEEHHRRRFERYLRQVQDGTVWKRDHAIRWQCLECGFIFEGTEPPAVCPGCDHPYNYYKALDMVEYMD